MKPFLRWAGSKLQLLPELQRFWKPEYKRYVEPFCGSACLFFSLRPNAALLSDANAELICTLRQVQTDSDIVVECLQRMRSDEKSYYRIRSISPERLSPNERAARFIYLNRHCFNGLYRTNSAGHFNVPYGSKKSRSAFDAAMLREAGRILANATIETSDFEDILEQSQRGDFVYLDPPYATHSSRIFCEYGAVGFTVVDLDRLHTSLVRASRRGAAFVLSYADVPEMISFRAEWASFNVTARRNISGFAGSRRQANELLITNCG